MYSPLALTVLLLSAADKTGATVPASCKRGGRGARYSLWLESAHLCSLFAYLRLTVKVIK